MSRTIGTPQQPTYMAGQPFNVNTAASQSLRQAMGTTQREMGYQPMQVNAFGYNAATMRGPQRAQQVQAGQLAGTSLSPYMNPYESQVVQQSLADLERSRQMQQNQVGAQATSAGAFGGSRHGIAEAETNRAFAEQAARSASGLRQAGYTQAQQAAQQDIGARMQAALANQSAGLQTTQMGQSAQQANQAAINAARQAFANQSMQAQQLNQGAQLAGSQQRLGAASQLAGLGQQGFNYGQQIASQQLAQGGMAQALQQQLLDRATQQYQGYTGSPQAALNTLLTAVGAGDMGQQTQTAQKQPGLLDWASVAAMAYASDPRLKDDVKKVGNYKGINFYTWKWNDEGKKIAPQNQPEFGVMADELQKTHPHLVTRGDDGYLRVYYSGLRKELEAA
jgi:hypothetical protein